MINCLCIFNDTILEYIIKNYISRTPFLQYHNWKDYKHQADLGIDLIIAELNGDTEKDIDRLRTSLSKGYFIFFYDNNNFNNYEKYPQSYFLSKNLTYADFIETLSLVVDNNTFDRMIK